MATVPDVWVIEVDDGVWPVDPGEEFAPAVQRLPMSGRVLAPLAAFPAAPVLGSEVGPVRAWDRDGRLWHVPRAVVSGYGSGCVEMRTAGPFWRAEGGADEPVAVEAE